MSVSRSGGFQVFMCALAVAGGAMAAGTTPAPSLRGQGATSTLQRPTAAGPAAGAPAFSSFGGAGRTVNLCYNGSFDSTNAPLDGWNIDYRWAGNSHYMGNHAFVTQVASYQGQRNVMYINGAGHGYTDTKVECRPIPYEKGARYQCVMDLSSDTSPHIYFVGYKWKPGVRPYTDEPAHLGDLRRIYKSEFRNHKVTSGPSGWKRLTFEFPLENPSQLAQQSLAELRFFTVITMVVADYQGHAYVDNVKITRIK